MRKAKDEKEVYWNRKAKTMKRVETLIRQAAEKIGWDGDVILGLVKEREEIMPPGYVFSSYFQGKDVRLGFDVNWDGNEVTIYMYSD